MSELALEPRAPAWVASVTVDGAAIELDDVLASVSVRHGRDDVDGQAQASTATLTFRNVTPAVLPTFEPGLELDVVATSGRSLFVGVITDETLLDDGAGGALEVIATGVLAIAGRRPVGGHAWPAELWAARVQRILAEAGLELVVTAPTPDVPIAATKPSQEADPDTGTPEVWETVSALDALERAREDVGAAIFDDAGSVYVQAFDSRAELFDPIDVDPALVLYAPAWSRTLDVANRIVLGYGYGDGSVTVDDPVSQGRFGVRMTGYFETGLADEPTARDRAVIWLDRVAFPRWKLPEIVLLEPHDLHVGQKLELSDLPAWAPFLAWSPIVEGWTDTIEGDLWTQTVVVSDPVFSGLAEPWADVPATLLWQDVAPACLWRDTDHLSNLSP